MRCSANLCRRIQSSNHHPIIQSRHRSKSFRASPRATLGRRRPSTLEISHRERHRFDVAPRTARRAPRVERAAVSDAVCPTSYVRTQAPATRPRAPFRERFRARPRSRAIGVPTAPEGVTARGRDRSIARFPAKTAPTTDDADRRPKSDVDDLPRDRSRRDRRRRDATRRRRRRRERQRRRFFFSDARARAWVARARVDARRVAGARRRAAFGGGRRR